MFPGPRLLPQPPSLERTLVDLHLRRAFQQRLQPYHLLVEDAHLPRGHEETTRVQADISW